MILRFRDLPLWAKVLIAPAVGVLAGLVLGVSVWFWVVETEGRLAAVADTVLPTAAASAALLDTVDKVQTMAMRATVWQQAGVPEANIDALSREINQALGSLQKAAAEMVGGHSQRDAEWD